MRSLRLFLILLLLLCLPALALADGYPIQQSSTTQPILIGPLVCESDHVSNATGMVLTVTISKIGGGFASPSGTVSEIANGYYAIAGNATDDNTTGPLIVNVSATLANATTAPTPGTAASGGTITAATYYLAYTWITPSGQTAVSSTATQATTGSTSTLTLTAPSLPVGCTGIDVYVGTSSGTLYYQGTSSTNSLTITAYTTTGSTAPSSNTATSTDPYGKVYQVVGYNPLAAPSITLPNQIATGTAQAGGSTSITLANTSSATSNIYDGAIVYIASGTGAGQTRTITAYNSSTFVATVDYAWTTNPTSSSVYDVFAGDNPALNSSLQTTAASVQGNVTGSVGSVTGAVGSVTGNVGGNVAGSVGSVVGQVGSVSGVTFPSTVPSLSQIEAGLPSDSSIPGDVWNANQSSYTGNGTTGKSLNSAGSAGDPWQTQTSTETTSGSFGKLLGAIQLNGSNYVEAAPQSDSPGTTTLLSRVPQTLLFDGSGYIKSDPYTLANTSTPSWYTAPTDPWATSLPGSYTSGQAGYLLGNLASTTAGDVWNYTIDGSIKAIDWGALSLAQVGGTYAVSYGTNSQTTTYKRQNGTSTIDTSTVTTDSSSRPTARSTTLTNLP